MRWEDGSPVTRSQLRKYLGHAGEQLGVPRSKTGTHSLRVGGATAVYTATRGNNDKTQRLGRSASDTFQVYIWEDRSLTQGLSSAMLRAPWSPHMGAF